jgi:hypothetical protein
MAYAAYRYPPGNYSSDLKTGEFKVLTVVIPTSSCFEFRKQIAALPSAGIMRCIPLPRRRAASENDASRVTMHIRHQSFDYIDVVHCIANCALDAEIGSLEKWADYLNRMDIHAAIQ